MGKKMKQLIITQFQNEYSRHYEPVFSVKEHFVYGKRLRVESHNSGLAIYLSRFSAIEGIHTITADNKAFHVFVDNTKNWTIVDEQVIAQIIEIFSPANATIDILRKTR